MNAITITKLTKKFGNFEAVKGINMNIKEGLVYGFIGPNGAGKTTTINMIMGHKKITSGTIEILGKKIDYYNPQYKQNIGYLSDVPEFYNWMNAKEYLSFCGELYNLNNKVLKTRIIYLLELVDLININKAIGTFSRGMRQRLGIAQALINDPKIIIMDEPTSALDPIGRKEIMDIIHKLKGQKTIFYSTHILSDVERVCDIIGIIHEGNIIIEDTLVNLKNNYFDTKFLIETDQTLEDMNIVFSKQSWLNKMYLSQNDIYITVNNENKALVEIPKLISENNWMLKKFIKKELTLEDIFLKVVNKQ